jgi:hypothetical protein
MILDADLTVAPEDLPKFDEALLSGRGELINGTQLVYRMEPGATRFINMVGNQVFAWLLTFVLGQYVRDMLCGTKVLRRADYERIDLAPEPLRRGRPVRRLRPAARRLAAGTAHRQHPGALRRADLRRRTSTASPTA